MEGKRPFPKTETPEPTENSLSVATEIPLATNTTTPMPSETPVPLGCVDPNIQIVYVWSDADLTIDACGGAFAQSALGFGESVIILEETPVALPAPNNCAEVNFIRVQSEVDDTIAGWVLDSQILRDEACP